MYDRVAQVCDVYAPVQRLFEHVIGKNVSAFLEGPNDFIHSLEKPSQPPLYSIGPQSSREIPKPVYKPGGRLISPFSRSNVFSCCRSSIATTFPCCRLIRRMHCGSPMTGFDCSGCGGLSEKVKETP